MKLLLESWRGYLAESDNSAAFIGWVKNLISIQDRPSGYKLGVLKKEKQGKVCAWCGKKTLVGVEHIVPRSAGGPTHEPWNLVWACYPCNHARGPSINIPPRDPSILNGWLTKEFQKGPQIPTHEQLKAYFNKTLREQKEEGLPTSEFGPFMVYLVEPDDELYETFKDLFKKDTMGHGFFLKSHDLIVIDGGAGLDSEQLRAVEAHEAAHGHLGHEEYGNLQFEKDADELAIEMLTKKGYNESADLLRGRWDDYETHS